MVSKAKEPFFCCFVFLLNVHAGRQDLDYIRNLINLERALNVEDLKVATLLVIFAGSCMQFIFVYRTIKIWFLPYDLCRLLTEDIFMFFSAAWIGYCKNLPFDYQPAFRRTSTVVPSPFLLVARLVRFRTVSVLIQVRLWLVCMVVCVWQSAWLFVWVARSNFS